ncbi:MAG: hypothetical protein Q9174_003557 [Haloplaca sp. 1 TL-2023]
MEILHSSPSNDQFTPLADHQSQTPASFYSGPPVLHHHSQSAQLSVNSQDLALSPALSALVPKPHSQTNGSTTDPGAADGDDTGHEVFIPDIDIWVTSEKFLLFSPLLTKTLSIPYPTISLHATQREPTPSLLLQILVSGGAQFDDHDPDGTISLTIIPKSISQTQTQETSQSSQHTTELESLFAAVSACADLHPDAGSQSDIDVDDDGAEQDGDGDTAFTQIDGLPPPMPGSGGWITAENVGEYFDEEGNYRGGGLGPGAGMVRERDDDGANGAAAVGEDGDGEESKWRRTG